MKIWKVRADSEHYAQMSFTDDVPLATANSFCGIPKLPEWKPIPVNVWDAVLGLPHGDIAGFEEDIQFLNEKARSILQPLFQDYAEFLPVDSPTAHCYAMHTTKVMDVFDPDHAQASYFDAEKRRIILCDRYAFKNTEQLRGVPLFRIPQETGVNAFVTEAFIKAVIENGLTGLLFELVWDSEKQNIIQGGTNPQEQSEKKPYFEAETLKKKDKQKQEALFEKGCSVFGIDGDITGKELAARIYALTEAQRTQKALPAGVADADELCQIFGVLFGHAVCTGHGWKWKLLKSETIPAQTAVVSKDGMFCVFPAVLISRILSDEEEDNTVLLLYNMLANIKDSLRVLNPDHLKYCPIS